MDEDYLLRLQRLSPQKRALLVKRLQKPDTIVKQNANQAPLSYAQQQMWLIEQLHPNTAIHNIAGIASYSSNINMSVLKEAIFQVICRHQSLSTAIVIINGVALQKVCDPYYPEIDYYDLSDQEVTENSQQIINRFVMDPFNLAVGKPLRIAVIKDTNHYNILVCLHHMFSDGWSTQLFLHETNLFYLALSKNELLTLPPLPIQYIDYSLWQRSLSQKKKQQEQLNYWIMNLKDMPDQCIFTPEYATDNKGTAKRYPFAILPSLSQSARDFATSTKITLFNLLLSCYAIVLHHYSRQLDFAIGIPVSGRENKDIETVVGCFVNLLAIRSQINKAISFAEYCNQMAQQCLQGFSHANCPFLSVIEALHPTRNMDSTPLFQSTFSYEREAKTDFSFQELANPIAKFQLSLELVWSEKSASITGWIDYDESVFSQRTVESLVTAFNCILENGLANPHISALSLPLVDQEHALQIAKSFNQTSVPYPRDESITQVFSRQVSLNPNQIAIADNFTSLSYLQLEHQSNAAAFYLISKGIQPGDIVALYLPRSINTIIAIFAVLKVGGIYLPLDDLSPYDRLLSILNDCNCRVILYIDAIIPERFENYNCINWSQPLPSVEPSPLPNVSATNHAYIMYTSGSTGKPKGVQITHRNIVRLVYHATYVKLGPEQTSVLLAPLAFDASTFELYAPLLNGGKCIVAESNPLSFEK